MCTKICKKCGTEKPIEQFIKVKGKYTSPCKRCKAKMDKAYREKNKYKLANYFKEKDKEPNRKKKNKLYKELNRFGFDATAYVQDKKCSHCGLSNDEHIAKYNERLHLHHKNNDGRKNQRLGLKPVNKDLVVLCRSCHVIADNRMRGENGKTNKSKV